MQMMRQIIRPVSLLVSTAILSLGMYMPAAQAAMVSTDALLADIQGSSARIQLQTTLQRTDVQQALLEKGVDPLAVQARVDALSDAEVTQLAAQLDALPAGGDGLGTIVFLFLVLVVLDIVCLTNIFPFTVKHCR